jgi:hypothetical protein
VLAFALVVLGTQTAVFSIGHLLVRVHHAPIHVLVAHTTFGTGFKVYAKGIMNIGFKAENLVVHVYPVVLGFALKHWADAVNILNVKCLGRSHQSYY